MSDISRPRILVTRPLPQGEQTAEKLRALGYAPVLAPMLRIEPITPPKLPSFDKVQAVLVTSRNGIARLSALTPLRTFTVLAVGDRTATAAKDAGFLAVQSATGDGSALLEMAQQNLSPDAGPIIHIRGRHAAVEFGKLTALGYDFSEIIAYEAVDQQELPKSAFSPIPSAALIYSARTAQALADAMRKAGIDPRTTAFIGISAAALAPLAASSAHLEVAKTPDEPALFAALGRMFPPSGKN